MTKPKEPKYVKPRADVKVNQTAPIFNDRRTKRNRDRSTQLRKSIERSKEE
jgi:hypothetical protein